MMGGAHRGNERPAPLLRSKESGAQVFSLTKPVPPPSMGRMAPSTPGWILVVDDDRATVLMLSTRLIREGYRVLTAWNGADAWGVAELEKPVLVISDMLLPGMDGIELCRRIKAAPELAGTRVILATAVFKQAAFRAEARVSGADEFIEKPFDMDAVLAKVRALIGEPNP
jgi:DNA-binding response OmpR family regulator